MKTFLLIIIGLTTYSGFAQTKNAVDLRWKIARNELLQYSTVLNEIDTSKLEVNFDHFFKLLTDSTGKSLFESKKTFDKINEGFKNQDFITTLSNKGNGVIDILMSSRPEKEKIDSTSSDVKIIKSLMETMNQGVQLRGSVYESGGVHSFWVKSNQKNLIALIFELPQKPVKIGDKWSLDVNLIANDQNFICDSAAKVNEVTLIEIKKVKGETIAVLKYNVMEYVRGIFNSPFQEKGKQDLMINITHQGLAEFSVDRGRWVSYDGLMSMESTGYMTSHKKTKLTLIAQ